MKKLLLISLMVLSLVLVGCKDESMDSGAAVVEVEGCEDSDGGIDKSIKGEVSVDDEVYTDQCVAGLVIEYYCDGGKAVNQNMRCSNECSNGKCV